MCLGPKGILDLSGPGLGRCLHVAHPRTPTPPSEILPAGGPLRLRCSRMLQPIGCSSLLNPHSCPPSRGRRHSRHLAYRPRRSETFQNLARAVECPVTSLPLTRGGGRRLLIGPQQRSSLARIDPAVTRLTRRHAEQIVCESRGTAATENPILNHAGERPCPTGPF